MGPMIKLVGVIQPVEKKTIRVEGETYAEAHAALTAEVPEGWQMISVLTER